MPLPDFVDRRRVLVHGARRYVVRRPRWSTVNAALRYYGHELVAIAHAYDLDGGIAVDDALRVVTYDWRAGHVLETCVDTDSPTSEWPCAELTRVALSMLDIDRVRGALLKPLLRFGTEHAGDESEPPKDAADGVPGDEEISATVLALRFSCSPCEVLEWPYEAVLETTECLKVIDRKPGDKRAELNTMLERFADGETL